MTAPMIVFESLSKWYPLYHPVTAGLKRFLFGFPRAVRSLRLNRFEALRNISFSVYPGETFGIIGRNGAGKSTTLGLIAGVLSPSSGSVEVKGRVSPLLELGSGFHQELTGAENIELNGVLLGLSRRQVADRLQSIIEFSELGDYINQPIRTYSSGMLARLGFSIVAHLDPHILLIDEILAVGDLSFQKKCTERLEYFKKNGVTMVFVSHSMEDVTSLCDRVMWIEGHTVRMIGPPAQVVEAYIGSIQ
ncbi:MAG: ABC transporter ATP-binding protein [Desulfomonilaceae bacterium]